MRIFFSFFIQIVKFHTLQLKSIHKIDLHYIYVPQDMELAHISNNSYLKVPLNLNLLHKLVTLKE